MIATNLIEPNYMVYLTFLVDQGRLRKIKIY